MIVQEWERLRELEQKGKAFLVTLLDKIYDVKEEEREKDLFENDIREQELNISSDNHNSKKDPLVEDQTVYKAKALRLAHIAGADIEEGEYYFDKPVTKTFASFEKIEILKLKEVFDKFERSRELMAGNTGGPNRLRHQERAVAQGSG